MTLAKMRAQGVRSPWVICDLCHHEAVLNVETYADAVPVPVPPSARAGFVTPAALSAPTCRPNLPPANQANDQAITDSARLWFARGAKNDLHERFAQVRKQRLARGIWARIWALLSPQRGSHGAGLSSVPPR